MLDAKRLLSSVLLATGLVLVLAGLTTALGFTLRGFFASGALIAALLYTGAIWFAAPDARSAAASPVVLLDRSGRILAGPGAGQLVSSGFPREADAEIRRHVATAFAGSSVHFVADRGSGPTPFAMVPVRAADGTIPLAILTTAASVALAFDAAAISAVV